MAESIFGASPSCGDAQFGVASRGPRRFTITRSTRTWALPLFHGVKKFRATLLVVTTICDSIPIRERPTREEFEIARRHASGERKIFWISSRSSPSVGWQPSRSVLRTSRRASREMICVTAPVAARVLAKSGARRARAVGAAPGSRLPARLLHRVPRCHPARLRQRGLLVRETVETGAPPASAPSPAPAPSAGKPGQGQTPPSTPRSSPRATSPRRCSSPVIARGVAGQPSSPRAPPWRRRRSSSAGSAPASRGRLRLGLAQRRVMGGRAPCDDHRRPDVVLRLGVLPSCSGTRRAPRWSRAALDEKVAFAGGLGLICAFRALVAATKPGVEK